MATTEKINITGVQAGRGPNNSTPVRMELRTFLADADRRNLYLLGLERMQARPAADMKSWYQICGIHGLPFTPWNGEVGPDGSKVSGYCTHSSVCAPTRVAVPGTDLLVMLVARLCS